MRSKSEIVHDVRFGQCVKFNFSFAEDHTFFSQKDNI